MIYRDEAIYLPKLAVAGPRLKGYEFHNCLLTGPAIATILGATSMRGCGFRHGAGSFEDLLIELPEGRRVIGVIGLDDCTFDRCTFEEVGFAGTRDMLDKMRVSVMGIT